jgi:magnesium transporter
MQDEPTSAGTDSAAEEFVMHLTDEEIIQIVEAVRAQDTDVVSSFLSELTAADAAELVAKVTPEDRDELLRMYGGMLAPEIFAEMDPELRRSALSSMPANEVASIISALESDDAILLIETLGEERQQEIIHRLSAKTRVVLEEGLSFPEKSAGRLMQRNLVAIPQSWTVGKTIDYLRAAAMDLPEDFFDIFVTDLSYHLVGVIPLNRLVRARRHEKVESLTAESQHPIPVTMDQEEVAHIFRRDNLTSAPVVDEENRLLGVITIDDVIDVIDEEAQEDFLRLAGVDQGDLYRAALATAGTRFRWLFVNLLTAILASIVISFFGATIEQIVALAVLMPIVASMGGNAGTQALAVAVRALATRQISQANTMRLVWKETMIGTLNGALFAVIAGVVAAIWFGNMMLGVVIGVAMIVNLVVAGLCGAGIPIMVARSGGDPAVSSTVLLTTVTDVVGFFVFLGLASIVF